jgi:hypothetical protein
MARSVGRIRALLALLFALVALVSAPTVAEDATDGEGGMAALAREVKDEEGAFATILYDHGEESEALLLATRVLMRSIRDSHTRFRRIVIVPQDGLDPRSEAQLRQDDPRIEIVRAKIPNVFRHSSLTDHRTQLLHMRNKLVIWDDPTLAALKRVVYLDAENLVLRNLDEIFACRQFCAVDNGQSVVYANSLLVISPDSLAARSLYSDAIDTFMITGREYNYIGITQGFLPGLFEAFEESPMFFLDDDEGVDEDSKDAVVHRLPFYYSINHMVFYERMNWDLYRCKDKNSSPDAIPGPLLSYKYSGATVKPWFWLPYVYFQVFWHWQRVRETLLEDHMTFFITKFVSLTVIFAFAWSAYTILCLKLHTEPSGRPRRLSSWGLPQPGNAQPLSMDVFNSRVVRRACQISCSVLYAVASTPLVSSVALVLLSTWVSVFSVPGTMHPSYAGKLWMYLNDLLFVTVLLVFALAHTFRTAQWTKDNVPSSAVLLLDALWRCTKRLPILVGAQMVFLYFIGRTDLFMNPVLRPVVTFALFGIVLLVEMRILMLEMLRLSRQ